MASIIKKYGHLRPGTYEITTEPYWKNPQKYLSSSLKKQKKYKLFRFSNNEEKEIKKAIKELDNGIDFDTFEDYLRRSIQERERVKFEFTKNISQVIDILENWCASQNISLNDIKFIEYKDILKYEKDKDLESLKKIISENKNKFTYTKLTNLPDLIDHQNDFYFFEYNDAQLRQKILDISPSGVDRAIEVEFGTNINLFPEIMKPYSVLSVYGSAKNMVPTIPFGQYLFKGININIELIYILPQSHRLRAIQNLHNAHFDKALEPGIEKIYNLSECAIAHDKSLTPGRAGAILLSTN